MKNIKNRIEFKRRVEILWAWDYEDRELEEFPVTASGGFASWQLESFLKLAKLHPEYHIVSGIDTELYINGYVRNAFLYFLAEGDADPELIHDPFDRFDAHLLYSLNSGRTKLPA